jgi:hypothetical protein
MSTDLVGDVLRQRDKGWIHDPLRGQVLVQSSAVERNRLRLLRRSPLPQAVGIGEEMLPLEAIVPGTRCAVTSS